MNLFENIKTTIGLKSNKENVYSSKGHCPNCWGVQEYNGQHFKVIKAEHKLYNKASCLELEYIHGGITRYF